MTISILAINMASAAKNTPIMYEQIYFKTVSDNKETELITHITTEKIRLKSRFLFFLYSVIGLLGCSTGANEIIKIDDIIVKNDTIKFK